MSKLARMLAKERLSEEQLQVVQAIQNSFEPKTETEIVEKTSFSPSSLGWSSGKCSRRWYLAFSGTEATEEISYRSESNMSNGSARHEHLQEALSNNEQLDVDIEVDLVHEDPPIHGFVDAHIKSQNIPIEIKTASDQAFAYRVTKFAPANYHVLQLIIYMRILKSELGLLFYENRNDFENLIIPVFYRDYEEYADYLFDWLRQVRKAYDDGTMPNFFEGHRSNSKICKTCIFKSACDAAGEKDNGVDLPLLEMPK